MKLLSVIKDIIVWSFTKGRMQYKELSQTEENRSREFHSYLACHPLGKTIGLDNTDYSKRSFFFPFKLSESCGSKNI